MMSWLDNILAVPGIGIRLKRNLSSVFSIQNAIAPIFDYVEKNYSEFEVKQAALWGYSIIPKNKSGFNYLITPDNIVVNYKYSPVRKLISGSFPEIEKPIFQQYSELLELNYKEIEYVFNLLKDIEGLHYHRIGIVADANLAKNNMPPGLTTWIDYLSKPWNGQLVKIETLLLPKLYETDGFSEQCHHAINLDNSNPDNEIVFKLDWQRKLKKPKLFDVDNLLKELRECMNKTIGYFEKFGEGDLNYE